MQRDVLGTVTGDRGETHLLEQVAELLRVRGGVFDELEAVRAHGIGIERGSHDWPPEEN